MTARRWLLVGAAALAAAIAIAGRPHRAARPPAPVATTAPGGYLAPAGPAPTVTVDVTAVAAPATDDVPAGPPTPTEAAAFASSLADAQCACRDGACLDAVNRRFAAGVGVVQPGGDPRAMHDAHARGAACAAAVRAAAPPP